VRYFTLGAALAALVCTAVLAGDPPKKDDKAADRDTQDFVYFDAGRPILVRMHLYVDGKPFLEAWDDYIDYTFKYFDDNNDGVLDKKEAERVILPQTLFNSGFLIGRNVQTNDGLDADRDGKVTRDELAAFYRKNGGAPFQVMMGPANPNNGRIAVAPGGFGMAGGYSTEALNEALFKALDTDGDGKLSKEELEAAPNLIAKLDGNDDEMISRDELIPTAPNPYGRVAVAAPPGMQAPPDGNSPFLALLAGESTKPLVQQLQTRYGKGGKKLTKKDLGLDDAAFKALDADGDGELDAEELAHFAAKPPDLELTLRLGKMDPKLRRVEIVKQDGALGDRVKAKDGTVTLDLGVTRVELSVGAGEARNAGFNQAQLIRQQYLSQFKAADTDNNGYLDEKEAKANPLFAGTFKLMDRDGDGMLYEKEVIAYLDKIEDLQTRALESCAALNVSDQGKGLFDLLDANRDGQLGLRELRQAAKLLESLDLDKDGFISRAEIPKSFQLAVSRGPAGGINGPFRIATPAVLPGQPRQVPARGPVWFQKMDKNHDGDVSPREFLGTEEEFKKIDKDGDGLISPEEADEYDALLHKGKK
jgi:Ca2+-binding EF-hand superfamily protein